MELEEEVENRRNGLPICARLGLAHLLALVMAVVDLDLDFFSFHKIRRSARDKSFVVFMSKCDCCESEKIKKIKKKHRGDFSKHVHHLLYTTYTISKKI